MPDLAVIATQDDVLPRFARALAALGDGRFRRAETSGINHTGDKALTAVSRALQTQTSASRAVVIRSLKKHLASPATLSYEIEAGGRPLTLAAFNPVQLRVGVRAKVWGRFQTFPHTFIIAKLSGQVFVRKGAHRFPLHTLFGPSIPKELIKAESKAAFEAVASELGPRLLHDLERLFAEGSAP